MDEAQRPMVRMHICPNCQELRSDSFSHDCRQLQIDRLKAKLDEQARTLAAIREMLEMRGIIPPGWAMP